MIEMKGPLPTKLPIVNHECFTESTLDGFFSYFDGKHRSFLGKHRSFFCIEFQLKILKWIFDQTISISHSFFTPHD